VRRKADFKALLHGLIGYRLGRHRLHTEAGEATALSLAVERPWSMLHFVTKM
jgi:hypothetical protein